jgi:hypothetical protein
MPRANIDQHLPEQSKQTGKLLILPEVKRIREAIRAASDERPDRRITASTWLRSYALAPINLKQISPGNHLTTGLAQQRSAKAPRNARYVSFFRSL